jgi:hypothetical protein
VSANNKYFYFLSDDPYFYLQFLPAAERPPSFFSLDTDGRVVRLRNKINFTNKAENLSCVKSSVPDPWHFGFVSGSGDEKSKRSHKTVGIQVFLTIFAWW